MDKNLRLRLVVRRNGLPETRILFNVPLAYDPTIANLVELVNDTIPLETEEWGLEDYAVELHDKDGNAFECLHFQPVASVLEKDDEVFVRPLLTNDLKKRRLSGRIQIAHGGHHLVDGVPYGRPRLRAPTGRPAVHIAPRKRRRLTYDGDFDQDDPQDDLFDDDGDDDDNVEPLLLTQSGEPVSRDRHRRVRFPRNLTANAPLQGLNTNVEDDEGDDQVSESDDGEDEQYGEDEEDDMQEELRGLSEEAAAHAPKRGHDREQGRFRTLDGNVGKPDDRPSASRGQVDDFGPFGDEGVRQEPSVQVEPQSTGTGTRPNPELIDKITAIRCAFPAVSAIYCEKLLVKHDGDVSSVWKKLAQQVRPRLDLARTMVLNTQLELPNEIQVLSSPPRKPAEVPGEVSRIEEEDDDMSSGPSSSDEQEEEDAEEPKSLSGGNEDESESATDSDIGKGSGEASKLSSPSVEHGGSDSSNSGSESDASEGDSRRISPSQIRKQQREKHQDSGSSSDGSSDSEALQERRISSRRRRNVIESSPQTSQATSGRAGATRGASKTPYRASSPLDEPDSSSSGESDEISGNGKKSDPDSSSSSSSDSESDSSSSSESSSESESDDQASTYLKTKKTPITSGTASTQGASSLKLAPFQASDRGPVPPGQGMTRTQKRNARRRLQKQRQAVSSDGAISESIEGTRASDADLIAKKAALLRSLGTSDALNGHSGDSADRDHGLSPATDAGHSLVNTDKDSEAWRQKISYRAVECVNEGVELSEPPFPFVQRWDPQQQRQRRGKRKSRNDTQFYDESSQQSAKKRRVEPSRQLVDAYEEDVTLNYDDVPVHPDEDSIANDHTAGPLEWNQSAEDDEDDLPFLPEDLTTVPSLRPEGLRPKMVIAWKQLLMSKKTNWQPMLSDFITAVVVEVEEGGQNFKVQLAKRDRDVDKTEKEYDEEGDRVYGKFEVPDDEDIEEDEQGDENEDLGFRDLAFAEMTDPRIVQQPPEIHSIEVTPRLPETDVEVADSQPGHNGDSETHGVDESHEKSLSTNDEQSKTLDHENHGPGQTQHDETSMANSSVRQGPDAGGESFISETNHDIDKGYDDEVDDGFDDRLDADFDCESDDESDDEFDGDVDDSAQLANPGEQDSISDELRKEISQLINEGGFRQEVRSSIDHSEFLRIGSPSRQLEEEASTVLFSRQIDSPQRASSEEAPSEYGSKDPSQQASHLPAPKPAQEFVHSAPQSPRKVSPMGHSASTSGPAISTGGVEYPSLNASFTSQTSVRSGRQLDPDSVAHSEDLGIELPDDSVIMGGFDDDDTRMDDPNEPEIGTGNDFRVDREQTPTQQIHNDGLRNATNAVITPLKSRQLGPEDSSPPGSGDSSSTRSSSIFLGIELIGSQPAKTKFQEHIKEEPLSAEDRIKGEPLSQPAQRMSQLPNVDDVASHSPRATSSKSLEKGRKSSVKGSPRSLQRTRRASLMAEVPSSSPAAATKSPGKGKDKSVNRTSTPNGRAKLFMASFNASVSPPTRSQPRQRKGSASSAASSQESRNPFTAASRSNLNIASNVKTGIGIGNDTSTNHQKLLFGPPKGSQVVSLLSSSPAPEESEPELEEEVHSGPYEEDDTFAGPESAYTEMYADDDVDEDYTDSVPGLERSTIRRPSSRAGRGASVPLAAADMADEQGWVPSTYQGPNGRASDRSGGRLSTAGF